MDVSRLDRGLQIAGAGGVVLFISLFLPWYGLDAKAGGFSLSQDFNAWQTFGFFDLLLFVCAAIAIAAAVLTLTGRAASLSLPVPLGQAVLGAGGLAVLIILFRLVDLPGGDIPDGVGVDLSRKFGIFIGLLAAAAVAFGGSQIKAEPYQPPVR